MDVTNAHKVFSFELFPPRTGKAAQELRLAVRKLAVLEPAYFSVTFGAAGSARTGTFETLMAVQRATGVDVAPHLSCIGATRDNLAAMLDIYIKAGVSRIVALRGDLPGQQPFNGEFSRARDLVRFIREYAGDHFHIEVAAYPEFHPHAATPDDDLNNLRSKLEAGAQGVITQYFFNPDAYFHLRDRARAMGIDTPIVPGIMPITNYTQLARFSDTCGAEIPRWIRKRLETYRDDLPSLRAFGLEVVTNLCARLLENGAPGLHFYTLNRAEPTATLWGNLGLGRSPKTQRANAR